MIKFVSFELGDKKSLRFQFNNPCKSVTTDITILTWCGSTSWVRVGADRVTRLWGWSQGSCYFSKVSVECTVWCLAARICEVGNHSTLRWQGTKTWASINTLVSALKLVRVKKLRTFFSVYFNCITSLNLYNKYL